MTPQLHILPNISRSKRNQKMKFGQLIECDMRNIFLEKTYTKWGGETSPRPFSEKLKLRISLDPDCKVLYSLFMVAAPHPPFLGGDLKISGQNNWGGPKQKIKFGGELNLRGDLKF